MGRVEWVTVQVRASQSRGGCSKDVEEDNLGLYLAGERKVRGGCAGVRGTEVEGEVGSWRDAWLAIVGLFGRYLRGKSVRVRI